MTTQIAAFITCLIVAVSASARSIDSKVDITGELPDDSTIAVWVYFTDKGNEATGLARTVAISEKAQLRRSRRGSAADADYYDREVYERYIDQVRPLVSRVRQQSRWLNAVSADVMVADLDRIAALPFVDHITRVVTYRRLPVPVADTPELRKSADDNPPKYGDSYFQLAQIGIYDMHNRGYTGAGMTILMLDTGFKISLPVFAQTEIDSTWDFINDDVDVEDNDSLLVQQEHGTMTFSVLGGNAYGEVIGAAYDASFLLAKTEIVAYGTEIQQEEDNWVAGIEWGEALGADVASSSLGYTDWYDFEDMDGNTAVTTRAADIAASLGVIVCNSQGNLPLSEFVVAPADGDSVIAVGAVNQSGTIASFSVHGPTADGRIKPDVCALGVGDHVAQRTGGFADQSGTSFACPLVAGAATLLLQEHPDWGYGEIYWALTSTASRASAPDNVYGYGIIDALLATGVSVSFSEKLTAYPNPCQSYVIFSFPIERPGLVSAKIYTVAAEQVIELKREIVTGKNALLRWDLRNDDGREIADGVYIVYITGPGFSETTKIFKVGD